MNNVTQAVFGSAARVVTSRLWQYDYGQILKITGLTLPAYVEVHFANEPRSGEAVTVLGTPEATPIPDSLLQTGKNVYAWLYLHDAATDGETEYMITIPVKRRPARDGGDPTPEQQDALAAAVTALNESAEALERAEELGDHFAAAAESWAVGGTGARPGEDADNARFYARVAQQGAQESGFAWFSVDPQDGNLYVTITPDLAADVRFAINEQTGELEAIFG